MEQAIRDHGVNDSRTRDLFIPLASQRNTVCQSGLFHRPFAQLNHRSRGIDADNLASRIEPGESDRNIGRTTAEIQHPTLRKLWEVFFEAIDESLILLREIGACVRVGLLWIVHEFRFKYTVHDTSGNVPRYSVTVLNSWRPTTYCLTCTASPGRTIPPCSTFA